MASLASGAAPRLLRAHGDGAETAIEGVERDTILKEFLFEKEDVSLPAIVLRHMNMDDSEEEEEEEVERRLAPSPNSRLRHRAITKKDSAPIQET